MAFKYWNSKEAVAEFGGTLKEWIKMYGLKGLYEGDKTEEYITACRVWAANSSTAMELLKFVQGHPKVIHIIGMSGGYQAFGSAEGNQKLPAIFLDLDASLKIANSHKFVNEPHNLHFDLAKRAAAQSRSGIPLPAPDRRLHSIDPVDFNNKLAVFHEIGHARQWIERPVFFENQAKAPPRRPKDAEEELDMLLRDFASSPSRRLSPAEQAKRAQALKLGGSEKDARLEGKQFAEDIRAGAEKLWARKTSQAPDELVKGSVALPARTQIETFYKERIGAWSRPVEFDNMARHEWPICKELGLPFRTSYTDLSLTSGRAQAGLSTEIIRKAEAEQAKKTVVEEGQNECPDCKQKVRNLVLHANVCKAKAVANKGKGGGFAKPVAKPFGPPPAVPGSVH